jgi:hypothetical protein
MRGDRSCSPVHRSGAQATARHPGWRQLAVAPAPRDRYQAVTKTEAKPGVPLVQEWWDSLIQQEERL